LVEDLSITMRNLFKLCLIFILFAQVSDANSSFSSILNLFQANNQYLNNGHRAYRNKDYKDAIKAYKKAIEKNPKLVEAYQYLGYSYDKLGDLNQSIVYMQKAISLAPNNPMLYLDIGDIYYAHQDYKNALTSYTIVTKLDPTIALGYIRISGTYTTIQDWHKTYTSSIEAIKRFPHRYEGYNNLAIAAYKMHKYDNAIGLLEDYIKYDDKNSDIYYLLSLLYEKKDDIKKFYLYIEKSIKLNPNNYSAILFLAGYECSSQHYQKSIELYKSLLSINPNDNGAYIGLVEVYLIQNKKLPYIDEIKNRFKNDKKVLTILDMLCLFDDIAHHKSIDLQQWSKDHNVTQITYWNFDCIQKWADTKDEHTKQKLYDAIKLFDYPLDT